MKIRTMGCYAKLPANHLAGQTAIIIDVLRSSTSMTCALMNGASKVIPTAEVDEAVNIAARMGGCVLAGERSSVRIPGFNLGNSPLEFTEEAVKDRPVVITTTNGTAAVCGAESAANVFIGSMINCTAVAKRAVELGNDIIIICAGTGGEISADDLFAAGAVSEAIISLARGQVEACDLTVISCLIYRSWKNDHRELAATKHCKQLIDMGMKRDVTFCFTKDLTDIVPVYRNGILEI